MVINYNSVPIMSQNYDVCDDVAPVVHKRCPLPAGVYLSVCMCVHACMCVCVCVCVSVRVDVCTI